MQQCIMLKDLVEIKFGRKKRKAPGIQELIFIYKKVD